VLSVDETKQRVIVESVNFRQASHQGAPQGVQSGILEREAPITSRT
jgi:ribosomal protein L24